MDISNIDKYDICIFSLPNGRSVMINDTKSISSEFKGVGTRKVGTLKPAINAIPKECFERSNLKGSLIVIRALVLWLVSLVILFSSDNIFILLPSLVFSSFTLAGMFVVGHDCAHNSLLNSKKANKIIGRLLFLPELHSYEAWLLGHNRIHHGHTVREQMDFVWMPSTIEEYSQMNKYKKFQHRIEWSFLGSGFYYIRNVWWNKMISFTPPERYKLRIQKDVRLVGIFGTISVFTLITYGFFHYGSTLGAIWMLTKIIAIPWFGFMSIIGWTVYVQHIAPDIKWWPRSEWDSFKGQVEGTTILKCQPLVNWLFFHNIFVHVPHHVDMRIPCYHLPQAGDALVELYPDIKSRKLKFNDYFSTTSKCKLYDFENHTWHNYDGKITG